MSKDELLDRLKTIANRTSGDPENDHADADELLLDYIDDPRITEAYEEIERWYA